MRTRVEQRIWLVLVASTLPESRAKLESLLSVSAGARLSLLDRLRNRRSAPELVRALQRVQEVRRLGIDLQVSQRIPPGRLQALARFASTAKVSAVQRLPDSRRLATLVAFACNLEARALDDALDLLDILITEIFN
ncbi:MAG TPA: Tn3 family transposase, partial [Edaphobacter sp.]|nr:Tn3 family transposase [Edaphobacter sp.]